MVAIGQSGELTTGRVFWVTGVVTTLSSLGAALFIWFAVKGQCTFVVSLILLLLAALFLFGVGALIAGKIMLKKEAKQLK